jgi:hypothetical protein
LGLVQNNLSALVRFRHSIGSSIASRFCSWPSSFSRA